ncbi:MAG: hypothetical protein LC799_17390, partial [Actinobacteria bacterium]|nr:hypothetical protein [Actinomycetota bacterium]
MKVLEDRYRRVLRMLPSYYRMEWEEEMVATFLASMETHEPEEGAYLADFGRPSVAEVASVVALAVRLRLGGAEAPPRSFLWGEAVRRVALVGLLTGAALMTMFTLRDLWLTQVIPWPTPPVRMRALGNPAPLDLWPRALWLCSLALIPAYLALVSGRWRAARVLAALALVPSLVRVASSAVEAMNSGPPMEYYSLGLVVGGA